MNVLMISSEVYPLEIGGVGIHVYYVSLQLSRRNHLSLLVPVAGRRNRNEFLNRLPHVKVFLVRLLPFPLGSISFVLNAVLIFLLDKKKKPDIIHVHWADIPTMASAYLISKLSGIPFVVSAHGSEIRLKKDALVKFIQRLLLNKAAVITCVSHDIMEILIKKYRVNGEKMFIVPNGYEEGLSRSLPLKSESCFNVVFVGSLREVKDPMTLIKGFKIVVRKYPNVKLSIIGDGPKYHEVKHYCFKEKLIEKVSLQRKLTHEKTINMVSESDIFVLTSVDEGLPTALIEAMCLGKPVICTNVGGVPEVVKDGINGVLVPPKSPEHVAEALERLLTDSELRRKLGKAAAESVKDYTWSKIAEKYEKMYHEVLQQGSQRC